MTLPLPSLRMLRPLRSFFLSMPLALLILSACGARHPLGISDDQWQTLSTEQRLQAHDKQASLDRAADERRAAEARAKEAKAAQQQVELDARRRTASYGERMQCILGDAQARLGGKWREVEPVALDLVQGMDIPLPLAEPASHSIRRQTAAYAHFDGQTIFLCQGAGDTRDDRETCMRVLDTHADYRRGIDQRIDSPNFLRGRLRCDLVPTTGASGSRHWK